MSLAEYEAAGWSLCGIKPGSKAPDYDGWNMAAMPSETIEALGFGAGLLHALSGTCAFDIDEMEAARAWWAEHGVDIDALRNDPESVHISSGRAGRDKLLYRLAKPMRTVKPKGHGFELRCATADGNSVQDVLPPSIHPVTKKPYTWTYGDELAASWKSLPNIPANVYRVWKELTESEPVTEVTAPVERPMAAALSDVRKAVRNFIDSRKLDMDNYDQWIEVGMRIHKQTGGDRTGLAIWDEVSKLSPKYKGTNDLKVHWLTFDAGGRIGLEAALREVPAAPEEFEVIEAPPETTETEAAAQKSVKDKIMGARELLEQRLVYVKASERYFDTESHRLYNSESAIRHTFTHMMPRRRGSHLDPVKVLQDSGTKIMVDKLGFHPGEEATFSEGGDKFANKYRNRLPRALEPTSAELDVIHWLFDRIDDVPYREWLLQFYGHVVQYPGVKINSAPLIWSDVQGNGKTTLVRVIPSLLVGREYSREANSSLLASDFNDYLLDAWHVNLTEFRAGSRGEREAISKKIESWIADDMVAIHPKGQMAYTMPNHFFVTASSNADDAASISNQDRKWGIHELKAKPFTQREQDWIYGFLTGPRASGVLRHYFLNLDLAGFRPAARPPETEARAQMVEAGIAGDVECMRQAFEERSGPFARDVVLTQEVREYVVKHSSMRPSLHRIGKVLVSSPFNGTAIQFRHGEGRYRGTALFNKNHWIGAKGADIMAHIAGDEISVDAEIDELLT